LERVGVRITIKNYFIFLNGINKQSICNKIVIIVLELSKPIFLVSLGVQTVRVGYILNSLIPSQNFQPFKDWKL